MGAPADRLRAEVDALVSVQAIRQRPRPHAEGRAFRTARPLGRRRRGLALHARSCLRVLVTIVPASRLVISAILSNSTGPLARVEREGRLPKRIRFFCRSSLLVTDKIGYEMRLMAGRYALSDDLITPKRENSGRLQDGCCLRSNSQNRPVCHRPPSQLQAYPQRPFVILRNQFRQGGRRTSQ